MVNFDENKENLSCLKEECCKRRNSLRRRRHVPHALRTPEYVRHRNNRERRRVEAINEAFSVLEKHVPFLCTEERNSKVNILNAAASYIRRLGDTLIQANSVQNHTGTLRPSNRLPLQWSTSTQINQKQNCLTNNDLSVNICNDSYVFYNQTNNISLNQESEINHLSTNQHQYVNHTSSTTQSDVEQNYLLDSNMNLTQYDQLSVEPRSGFQSSENGGIVHFAPWTNSNQRNVSKTYNTSLNSIDTGYNQHEDGTYRNGRWLPHEVTNNLHNNVPDTGVPYFTETSEQILTRLHTNIPDNQQTSTAVPVDNDVIFSDCIGHHCLDNLCIDSILGY